MKKWILIGSCAVLVIIVIIVVWGLSNLGPIIKNAVNTYGPNITKTEVRLGDVNISIFSAEANLKDFFLGNPKGFKSSQAMSVGSIASTMKPTIVTSGNSNNARPIPKRVTACFTRNICAMRANAFCATFMLEKKRVLSSAPEIALAMSSAWNM